jgi:hypothetical protein
MEKGEEREADDKETRRRVSGHREREQDKGDKQPEVLQDLDLLDLDLLDLDPLDLDLLDLDLLDLDLLP